MFLRYICPKAGGGGGGGGEGSGDAMVLGKLPVLGRPNNLDLSRARAFCACSRCGWELFGHFFSHLSFLSLSPSLWEAARYRLKYCLKGPLSPNNEPTSCPKVLDHSVTLYIDLH